MLQLLATVFSIIESVYADQTMEIKKSVNFDGHTYNLDVKLTEELVNLPAGSIDKANAVSAILVGLTEAIATRQPLTLNFRVNDSSYLALVVTVTQL